MHPLFSTITALSATNLPPDSQLRLCAAPCQLSTPALVAATSPLAQLDPKNNPNPIYRTGRDSSRSKELVKCKRLSDTRETSLCSWVTRFSCVTARRVNYVN